MIDKILAKNFMVNTKTGNNDTTWNALHWGSRFGFYASELAIFICPFPERASWSSTLCALVTSRAMLSVSHIGSDKTYKCVFSTYLVRRSVGGILNTSKLSPLPINRLLQDKAVRGSIRPFKTNDKNKKVAVKNVCAGSL